MGNIRILIADDHPLLRKALRSALEKQPDFEVVAEAQNGEEAVKLANQLVPDIVIMDIGMPVLNGLEATKQIKETKPSIAILVLTIHNDNEHVLGVLQSGASGYLTKSADDSEVINAIRALMSNEMVLSNIISKQLIRNATQYSSKQSNIELSQKLTSRETEILLLMAKGISNKDIAARLNLSERTVKGYLADLFFKLGVASRTEAVVFSLRKGILTMDDLE